MGWMRICATAIRLAKEGWHEWVDAKQYTGRRQWKKLLLLLDRTVAILSLPQLHSCLGDERLGNLEVVLKLVRTRPFSNEKSNLGQISCFLILCRCTILRYSSGCRSVVGEAVCCWLLCDSKLHRSWQFWGRDFGGSSTSYKYLRGISSTVSGIYHRVRVFSATLGKPIAPSLRHSNVN